MLRRLSLSSVLALAVLAAPHQAAAKTYGGADRDTPLARFEDPLCPGIYGVDQDQAEIMVGIIRQNASELGLRLDEPGTCEPNFLVMVIDDPRGYLAGLRDRKPYLFEWLSKSERTALFDTPGPAHTWTRVVVRSRDGLPIYPSDNLTNLATASVMEAHSLIYVPTRRDIMSAIVAIDRKAVKGMSVAQIAAYATMRGLSGDAAERLAAPGETILGLFDSDAAARPDGLTRSDWIFLKTLYSTMPNNPAAITLAMANSRIAGDNAAE